MISLQNVYRKLLEKIVAGKIDKFLEDGDILPVNLGSFRQG